MGLQEMHQGNVYMKKPRYGATVNRPKLYDLKKMFFGNKIIDI